MTNNCPECKVGTIYCKDIDNKWIEHCTNCDYQNEHINRRQNEIPINFGDRRKESGC